jgi:hypothetical protein
LSLARIISTFITFSLSLGVSCGLRPSLQRHRSAPKCDAGEH